MAENISDLNEEYEEALADLRYCFDEIEKPNLENGAATVAEYIKLCDVQCLAFMDLFASMGKSLETLSRNRRAFYAARVNHIATDPAFADSLAQVIAIRELGLAKLKAAPTGEHPKGGALFPPAVSQEDWEKQEAERMEKAT